MGLKELLVGSYCDGCRNACPLVAPRCSFGGKQAREWITYRQAEMAREGSAAAAGAVAGGTVEDAIGGARRRGFAVENADAQSSGSEPRAWTEEGGSDAYWEQFDL